MPSPTLSRMVRATASPFRPDAEVDGAQFLLHQAHAALDTLALLIGFPIGGIDHVEQCRDVGLPLGAATGRPLDLTFEQPMQAHFSPMVVIVMV